MFVRGLAFCAVVALATRARAEDGNPREQEQHEKHEKDTEMSFVPFLGGDTDSGFGGGALGAIEHYVPGYEPYRWRLETAAAATFKGGGDAGFLSSPYQDVYAQGSVIMAPNLELQFRISYSSESTLKYSGVGNASVDPKAENAPNGDAEYFRWAWVHPTASFGARVGLSGPFSLLVRSAYTHHWVDIPSQSKLRDDAETGSPAERELVRGLSTHAIMASDFVLLFDTRDDDVDPRWGQYHHLALRYSPEGSGIAEHGYGESRLSLSFAVTPVDPWLTLGARVVGDLLFGDPPFYELGRSEDSFVMGGASGVRGVQGQRYYGMVKTFGNIEARTRLLPLRLLGKNCELGAGVFFDAGRVWAHYESEPELDGEGLGLKYGIGGGPRLLVGKVLMVRGDVAWSPDAAPVSGYFVAGHAF